MGRGGTVLGLIGIILAAGSIGFTFIVWNGQNTSNNLQSIIVVGIWDEIDANLDYAPYNSQDNWLFEFGAHNLSNTDYISVSNNNTRIALLKSGWYRIHLSVLLGGIDPSTNYWITILKDGAVEIYLDRFRTTTIIGETVQIIDSSAFVFSDGTTYLEINAVSTNDFGISSDEYNQFSIEYVVI